MEGDCDSGDPASATELRALAAKSTALTIDRLDVEDRPAIKALAATYRGMPIDVVINNAGQLGEMKAQTADALDYARFEEMMADRNRHAPAADRARERSSAR